jgi:hypothetical protein
MTSHSSSTGGPTAQKPSASTSDWDSPKEAAAYLKVSTSWLAKRRMAGDGPPYSKFGRLVRYSHSGLIQYARSRQRSSTSE